MGSCRLHYLHIGVSTMTFSLKKDMIKKLGYVNLINAWDSLFTIYDRQFIKGGVKPLALAMGI